MKKLFLATAIAALTGCGGGDGESVVTPVPNDPIEQLPEPQVPNMFSIMLEGSEDGIVVGETIKVVAEANYEPVEIKGNSNVPSHWWNDEATEFTPTYPMEGLQISAHVTNETNSVTHIIAFDVVDVGVEPTPPFEEEPIVVPLPPVVNECDYIEVDGSEYWLESKHGNTVEDVDFNIAGVYYQYGYQDGSFVDVSCGENASKAHVAVGSGYAMQHIEFKSIDNVFHRVGAPAYMQYRYDHVRDEVTPLNYYWRDNGVDLKWKGWWTDGEVMNCWYYQNGKKVVTDVGCVNEAANDLKYLKWQQPIAF